MKVRWLRQLVSLATTKLPEGSSRRKRQSRQRTSSARPKAERLEDRLAPAHGITPFAQLTGSIAVRGEQDALVVQVRTPDFSLPDGSALLGFVARAADGSSLDPASIRVVENGRSASLLQKSNLSGTTDSLTLARIKPGPVTLTVSGARRTVGSYVVEVYLPGDVDGNFRVNSTDLNQFLTGGRNNRRSRVTTLATGADVDLDGDIDRADKRLAERNRGVSTRVRPLSVTLELSPESDPNGDGIVVTGAVTVGGQSLPGAMIRLDRDGDGTFDQTATADANGRYQIPTTLAAGVNRLHVEAGDRFGQVATADLTVRRLTSAGAPRAAISLPALVRSPVSSFDVLFSEMMGGSAFTAANYQLTIQSGPNQGQSVAISSVTQVSPTTARISLAAPLPQGDYQLTISAAVADNAGNPLGEPRTFMFGVVDLFDIVEISPADGEELVNVTREAVVRFSEPVNPATITATSIRVFALGQPVPGRLVVSSTGLFVTFFPTNPWPASTEVRIEVDGTTIRSAAGKSLDGDGDGLPGGTATADFTTLPLTRIQGTNVFGFVRDSFSGQPIVGATIRVDAFPQANAVTDATGRFELRNMPAPEFFVHIDGSTATNAPSGFVYPNVGKAFHSVPGQTTQLNMNGTPFDIFLPPMSMGDVTALSASQPTPVGFGAAGRADLVRLFPNIDPAVWNQVQVTFAPNSAVDETGRPATQAIIIPVPANRIPAPLPPNLDPQLVISVQAIGATNFDVPARVAFPNLQGLQPGEQSLLFSFNHDAGRWEVVGTGTVSADGRMIVSDPGSGIRAPGWHTTNPGNCGGSGGPPPSPPAPSPPDVRDPEVLFITGESGSFPAINFTADPSPTPPPPPPPGCAPPQRNNRQLKKTITITVDGNLGTFMKKTGSLNLASRTIVLPDGSGKMESFGADAKTYMEMFSSSSGFTNLNRDRLFGATVTIKEQDEQQDGTTRTTVRTLLLYRWVTVVDANQAQNKTGNTAAFFRTHTEGVTRTKRVDTFLPRSTRTTFDGSNSEFTFNSPSGSSANWTFDPSTAGSKMVPVTIKAEVTTEGMTFNKDVGTLSAIGTATAPTTVGINLAGYRTELTNVLTGLVPTNGTDGQPGRQNRDDDGNGTVDDVLEQGWPGTDDVVTYAPGGVAHTVASNRFKTTFQTVYPWVNPTPAELNRVLTAQSDALLAAVRADYNQLAGYQIDGTNAGDVTMNWAELGAGLFGSADGDPASATRLADMPLQMILSPSGMRVGRAAQQWYMAERINRSVANSGQFAVGININWTSGASFAQYMANTVSHEVGHTFGLIDSYDNASGGRYRPFDIMMNGGPADPNLTFGQDNRLLLKAALGTQGNGDLPLSGALKLYQDIFFAPRVAPPNLPRETAPPAADLPNLLLTRDEVDFTGGETEDVGPVVADGAGGQQLTLTYTVQNAGFAPLRIDQIALTNGTAGFTLQSSPAPGTTLDPFGMTTLVLVFDPATAGTTTDSLVIRSNAAFAPVFTLSLSGVATTNAAVARFVGVDNNLGGTRPGLPVQRADVGAITNAGGLPLRITGITLAEGGESFQLLGVPADLATNPLNLAPGDSFTIGARFHSARPGLNRGIVQVTTNDLSNPVLRFTVVGTGLPAVVFPEWGNDFIVVQTGAGATSFLQRTVSNGNGNFSFVLASLREYEVTVFDPVTGLIASSTGRTPASGRGVDLTADLAFRPSAAPDSDFDGFPDDVEFAIGTNAAAADSDGDGVDDLAELQQNLNPLDGVGFPTGVIASLSMPGNAEAVAVSDDLVFVATGSHGLAIVNGARFNNPVLLGQIDLPGNATDVGFERALNLAVVATGSTLELVNVTDPMRPRVSRSLPIAAQHVEVFGGFAYFTSVTSVGVVDLRSGEVVRNVTLPGSGSITGFAREGTKLYAYVSGSDILSVVDISEPEAAAVVGQLAVSVASSDVGLFAGNGVVWVAGSGLRTVNVSNPAQPALLHNADSFFSARRITLNGSGLGLLSPDGGNFIQIYDTSNPNDTDALLTQFALSGPARDAVISRGIGYVAAGGRLEVVNYRPFDTQGRAPQVTATSPAADVDPNTPGLQVLAGTAVPITVTVADDVQVRNVELLVDGQVVTNDVSFPFDFAALALGNDPNAAAITVQARATDTGGNATLSAPLVIDLVPDTFPPTVTRVDPANGSRRAQGHRTILVRFNEAIDPAGVTAANFQLFEAGPNGTQGNSDDVEVPAVAIELLDDNTLVRITTAPLAIGAYQLRIRQQGIRDRSGNAMPAGTFTSDFRVEQFVPVTINFNAGSGAPRSYTEAGLTVTSGQDHLHMGNQAGDPSPDLLNHSDCCSTPYTFTLGGAPFSVLSMDVVGGNVGQGRFTSSNGAVAVPTSLGTFTFDPSGWTGITSFSWDQPVGQMIIDNLVIAIAGGAPVRAAVTPAAGNDEIAFPVTLQEISELASSARAIWAGAVGADVLPSLTFAVTDLPDDQLATAQVLEDGGGLILIDQAGAGLGWFLDSTPRDDVEFSEASPDSLAPAAGRYDLLTVLLHEMGHLLGLTHSDTDRTADHGRPQDGPVLGELMDSLLLPGVRRLPSVADLDLLQRLPPDGHPTDLVLGSADCEEVPVR